MRTGVDGRMGGDIRLTADSIHGGAGRRSVAGNGITIIRFIGENNYLTDGAGCINLSAFVDATNLMQSGRGTGPMKPRQPVEILILMQVPIPAWTRVCPGKMRRAHIFFVGPFSVMRWGFLFGPGQEIAGERPAN